MSSLIELFGSHRASADGRQPQRERDDARRQPRVAPNSATKVSQIRTFTPLDARWCARVAPACGPDRSNARPVQATAGRPENGDLNGGTASGSVDRPALPGG